MRTIRSLSCCVPAAWLHKAPSRCTPVGDSVVGSGDTGGAPFEVDARQPARRARTPAGPSPSSGLRIRCRAYT